MSTTCPIKSKEELMKLKNYYLQRGEMRNYLLLIIGVNTALRISDILSLKWKDVYNMDKQTFKQHIQIYEQKTGKYNMIAINNAVKEALLDLVESDTYGGKFPTPDTYLFESRKVKNMPLSRYQAYRIIKGAAEHIGIEATIGCHSLRKTFGYFAWKQGVEPAMLMNIYNHSSYQITKRYLSIEQDDKDKIFKDINL